MADGERKHLLNGFKVLDFTQFVAGPTVTKLMAEMGAEIVKVEIAPSGDRTRTVPYLRNNRSGYFVQQNRGKMSLCLDIKNPQAKAILRELVTKVDVLAENFAPGAIARMGFGYEDVRKINPRIVMCSVSALGQNGPLAHDPGYDFIGQAYAGVTWLSGEEGSGHYPPMLALGDVSTGVHGLAAVACALLYRDRTGEGQHIDVSLLDSYFSYHDTAVQLLSASGGKEKPVRMGPHYQTLCPAGLYKGHSRYFFIFAWLDHHWVTLCNLMGKPELGKDPRFADNASRVAHRDEIAGILDAWLESLPDDDTATELLRESHIPAAPVLTVEEAMNHPHLIERRTVRTVHDRLLGDFQIPGFPMRFSGFPKELEIEAPLLGEHNEKVLSNYLGYGKEQIERLKSEGVLYSAPY